MHHGGATADSLAAQREIWIVGAVAVVDVAPVAVAAAAVGELACSELRRGVGRHHPADLAEEQRPREPARDELVDVGELLLLLLCGRDEGGVAVGGGLPAGGIGGDARELALASPARR